MKTKLALYLLAVVVLSTLNSQLSTAKAQGSLTPPGPPGPTMLTLSQVEPRTPISSVPFTIGQPGSYYLTTNLALSSGTAITISASGVTLDLNGFTLLGTAASDDGITTAGPLQHLIIRNGIVQGWFNGIDIGSSTGGAIERVCAFNNGGTGMSAGEGFLIQDCLAISNNYGISASVHCVVVNNNCLFNTNSGFYVNPSGYWGSLGGNRIQANSASGNGIGFSIGSSSNLVVGNFAQGNVTNNYGISGNNNPGPIITGGMIATNNSPYANFSF